MTAFREAAVEYARSGFHIFPVEPRGKRPMFAGGFKTATTDLSIIEQSWTRSPDANIGLWPGPSGLVVADIDGPEGEAAAADLGLTSLRTRTVNTGRADGGRHLYLTHPGFPIGNARPARGLDVRADRGYVLVPPSVHPSGRSYVWVDPAAPILPAPAELLKALQSPIAAIGAPDAQGPTIAKGERNTRLTSVAGALRRYGLGEEAILGALLSANEVLCDPPLGEREIRRIARSVARYEPSQVPEDVAFRCTDLANARRLAEQYGGDLLNPAGLGWLAYDGHRFRQDETGAIYRAAKDAIRTIPIEAAALAQESEPKGKMLLRWALVSQGAPRVQAMVTLAASEPEFTAMADDLDADPWLLNVVNGTIDLRTGELRPHRREDRVTRLAPVAYDPTAECPRWDAFLLRVLAEDMEAIAFLQRACGYALTGSTGEQCLFLLFGEGANGKSTFLETISYVLSDYATAMNFSTLTSRRQGGPSEDIARLRGLRFVTAIETGLGQAFNEELLKQLTGGDTVAARFLFKNTFTFRPQFKLFLAANHRPAIKGTDHAIWRRIRLVPFTVQIPPRERDRSLAEKLRSEAPGILRWLVEGCRAWQRDGLGESDAVHRATSAYRDEQDFLRGFLADECERGPDFAVDTEELFNRYCDWCIKSDREAETLIAFGRRLTEAGFGKDRRGPSRRYRRLGVRLLPEAM